MPAESRPTSDAESALEAQPPQIDRGDRRYAQATRDTAKALREMFAQIIANNRAGGWRKLKKEPSA